MPQSSVFTLGFAPPPSLSGAAVAHGDGAAGGGGGYAATAAAAETVTFVSHHHNSSFSPGKEFMPAGKEVMKKAPLVILKTKRLLRNERHSRFSSLLCAPPPCFASGNTFPRVKTRKVISTAESGENLF